MAKCIICEEYNDYTNRYYIQADSIRVVDICDSCAEKFNSMLHAKIINEKCCHCGAHQTGTRLSKWIDGAMICEPCKNKRLNHWK